VARARAAKSDWARVSAILERGLDLPAADRDRFFSEQAGGDTALLAELRELARSYERAEAAAFISQPLAAEQPDLVLNTLTPGQRIGAYEIVEEAGRGGMGVVYRARDTRLGRDVAVKCVAEGASASQRARLEHEARLAARLSHPAIATVFALEEQPSAGSGETQVYLVQEFVPGETLRARLARGKLTGSELHRAARAIAEGLAAAHREQIAHGDLKPENIVLRPDGQVKILDFGLAELRHETTPLARAEALAGTPGYMAPEQLRGRLPDARADVFAFGVLLFEMATGRHPFAADRGAMLEAALSSRAAYDAPDLPPELSAIVTRCLAPDPTDRFASAGDLVTALEQTAARPAAPRADRSMMWFLLHQRVVSALAAAMPIVMWIARPEFGRPRGSLVFLFTLAGATVVVALRLNIDFMAREHPADLRRHLQHVRRRLWMAELALDTCVLAAGIILADRLDWAAGVLFGCGVASIIALSVIEPATTRAALRGLSPAIPR
jgi:hypothetical protein